MTNVSAQEVRSFVLMLYSDQLSAIGLSEHEVPDNLDLLSAGVIDSLGLLELVTAIEERFRITVDFEDLDPDELTVIGPFCRYTEARGQPLTNSG